MQAYKKLPTEDEKKEEFNRSIKMMLNIYHNTMNRYKNIKDPSTKFTLLLDKLCFVIDIALAALNAYTLEEKNLTPELQVELDNATRDLQNELGKLADWIQSPVYGPDHPYGNQLMQESAQNFEKSVELNDKKNES